MINEPSSVSIGTLNVEVYMGTTFLFNKKFSISSKFSLNTFALEDLKLKDSIFKSFLGSTIITPSITAETFCKNLSI